MFLELRECGGSVKMGNGTEKIVGYGTVSIVLTNECGGYTIKLSDVMYIPSFTYRLISGHKLAKKGFFTTLNERVAIGRNNSGEMIFKAPESKNKTPIVTPIGSWVSQVTTRT